MAERTLVITGPTASGKSALALALAERLHGEIISMDSRQVYRGLDIGTAKPTREEQHRIRHHGLDLIDPGERYSAGQFARDARMWLHDIRARGHTPIVVGGTLFFLRALQQPLFDEPSLDAVRRDRLRDYLNSRETATLRAWAEFITGARASGAREASEAPDASEASEASGATPRLPVDRQRLARLIEIATLTGRTLSQWHQSSAPQPGVETITFVMTLDRATLYRRINERVEEMVRAGFVEEVRGLVAQGGQREHPGMNATGYQEMVSHLAGERSVPEAVALIQAASRQYARRQLTWLRTQLDHDEHVHALDATLPIPQLVDEVSEVLKQESV